MGLKNLFSELFLFHQSPPEDSDEAESSDDDDDEEGSGESGDEDEEEDEFQDSEGYEFAQGQEVRKKLYLLNF